MSKRLIVILIAATWAVVGIAAGTVCAQSATPRGEQFVLSGLVYVEGGRGLAWLQEPTLTSNHVIVLRVGDTVGPYRLTKILDDQIELEGPGGKLSVPLAGIGGAVSVAALPESGQQHGNLLAHPAYKNPEAIVLERGDPRRNFPASALLIGAGAKVTGIPPAPKAPQARAVDRGIVPPALQAPPPSPPAPTALQNPNATIIPRGDPRQEFPASSLLIGAGARVTGGH